MKKKKLQSYMFTIWTRKVVQQKMLNISKAHVLAREYKAADGKLCVYHDEQGGCGFAPFIEEYSPDMECKNADVLMLDFRNSISSWIFPAGKEFCNALQSCHDRSDSRDFHNSYRNLIHELAEVYKLNA